MEPRSPDILKPSDQVADIFESDEAFIRFASSVALIMGGLVLLGVLLCKLLGWNLCLLDWVPVLGGLDIFRGELLAINFPLALLILGIGMRLFTGFGWTTCVLLLWVLLGGFLAMAYVLNSYRDWYFEQIANEQIYAADYPLLESIVVNLSLALFCLLAIWYLMHPAVRKLYWNSRLPAARDASAPE